jgi:hypothetical protein
VVDSCSHGLCGEGGDEMGWKTMAGRRIETSWSCVQTEKFTVLPDRNTRGKHFAAPRVSCQAELKQISPSSLPGLAIATTKTLETSRSDHGMGKCNITDRDPPGTRNPHLPTPTPTPRPSRKNAPDEARTAPALHLVSSHLVSSPSHALR